MWGSLKKNMDIILRRPHIGVIMLMLYNALLGLLVVGSAMLFQYSVNLLLIDYWLIVVIIAYFVLAGIETAFVISLDYYALKYLAKRR